VFYLHPRPVRGRLRAIAHRGILVKKIITDKSAIESIIRRALVCRIAMLDGGQPYVVPVCFGYEDNILYFHSSNEGRKLDMLSRNNAVCFEVDVDHEIVRGETACKWGMKYRSVIGFGRAFFAEGPEEKKKALDAIMAHYDGGPGEYSKATLRRTMVVRVEIESMTGKVSGY
jgi:nitroimidazol reductase NimA-like FMN-containing flavoprotein (pyridoxamine 5'-phosphate oxidase superfamily)